MSRKRVKKAATARPVGTEGEVMGENPNAIAELMLCLQDKQWDIDPICMLDKLESLIRPFNDETAVSAVAEADRIACISRCAQWLQLHGAEGIGLKWSLQYMDDIRGTGIISMNDINVYKYLHI